MKDSEVQWYCHSCGSRNPEPNLRGPPPWIPAFAGMTKPELAYVHSVNISPYFASSEGEGFPPSPMVTLNRFICRQGRRKE
jgi:hypothetical protein